MKQINIVCLLTIITLLISSRSFFSQEQQSNTKEKKQSEIVPNQDSNPNSSDNTKGDMVYQCPNDLGVISNTPGRCSKCDTELEEFTMDEAMNNLSGHSKKKPELKNKRLSSGKEEKNETEENIIADESIQAEENILAEDEGTTEETNLEAIEHESQQDHGNENLVDASKMDENMDGRVHQCPMCPDQLSDESSVCGKCGMELQKISVEDAQIKIDNSTL